MKNSIQEKLTYYKAIVSYQGTHFHGWQSQTNLLTVQDSIESTLYKLFNFKQRIIGASRTDSGVHAYGQVISFYAPSIILKDKLFHLINNNLPETIFMHTLEVASNHFHPRFDAKKKIYQYLISQNKLSPAINFFILHYQKKFDITILQECFNIFIGTHDFRSFCTAEDEKNTIRTIYSIDIDLINGIYIINIIGNGFLRYMIRRLLGAALYAATKKIDPLYIKTILLSTNKNNNLMTLPAKGLLLKNIIYNEDEIINTENPFLTNFNFYPHSKN
jgi:tRNA pseudouridine38-40 synthase